MALVVISISGVVENQRFSGAHSRQFAPLTGKLGEKPGENRQKSGGKWRKMALFRGSKRHFGVLGADGARSQTASLPDLTSVESGCIEPPPTRPIGNGAPFFTDWGTDRHV